MQFFHSRTTVSSLVPTIRFVYINFFLQNVFFYESFIFVNYKFSITGVKSRRSHQQLILLQSRKGRRLNHWKALIAKEIATVLAIIWYIKVKLLRTKQLLHYITYGGIDKVPLLMTVIHKQASFVYSHLYRKDDKASKCFIADTGEKNLDGKVGTISSYDTIKCCYIVQVSDNNHRNSISSTELFLLPENMEPFSWTTIATHTSSAACDLCQVNIKNHFASSFPHASPSVTFWPCVLSEIGGHSQSPHTEGENQRNKLMSMLEKKKRLLAVKQKRYKVNNWSSKKVCQKCIRHANLYRIGLELSLDKNKKAEFVT